MKQFPLLRWLRPAVSAAALLLAGATGAQAQTTNLVFTGASQTFTVPAGVTSLQVDMSGGAGGDGGDDSSAQAPGAPGQGGRVQARLAVTAGQVLTIVVGGAGATPTAGYNTGGAGGPGDLTNGGGGGGASVIFTGGTGLANRILVAGGGGGGGGGGVFGDGGTGGAGGGLTGGDGTPVGGGTGITATGGSQTAAGTGFNNGVNATGGAGATGSGFETGGGGGGGGGYFGGGSGGASSSSIPLAGDGGAGGSSYAGTGTSAVTHTQGYRSGNGYVTLSYSAATITTTTPSSVTGSGATLGGNISTDGGATVTERGVVYSSTATTPTTANTKVPIGSGTGSFSQAVTGLSASTTYYVRAYSINAAGTSYGAVQQFTTSAASTPPTITNVSPTSGVVGTTVTVTGTNFTGTTGVTLNGVAVTGYTVVNATTITFAVPSGATSGQIAVTTPGGTATSTGSFTVTPPAPTITSFSPTSGSTGATVTVTGTNFTGATAVKLNGVAITGYTVVNPTTITFAVPSGATSGQIAVTTPGGTATSTGSFTVSAPAPTISSVSPTSGSTGTTVTVTGTNFTGTTGVTLNGVAVTGYTVVNPTTVTFTVPSGATSGPITVTTPGGTATSTGSFTVTPPAPTITSLSPTSGSTGTTVTVTGTNFTGTTSVKLNGVAVTGYTVVSPTQITFSVPSGATSGPISVTTPGGTATSTGNFTVTPPAPTITSTSPTSGVVGTTVTVTGTNFTGTTGVTLNGVAVTGYTVVNPTTITFSVPSGATSGPISVTTPGGTATSSGNFTVTPAAPTITNVGPSSGPVGTTVTVTGTNFTGTTGVTLNGVAVTGYTVVNPTTITFSVPSGATSGPISVTTPGGTATSSGNFTVTPPAPTVTNVGPSSGTTGTTVTVTGTNFTGTTGVTLNGVAVTGYTVVNPTTITFSVPSGATSGPISVTTPGGTATSSGNFTVTPPPAAPTVTNVGPSSGTVGTTVTVTGTNFTGTTGVTLNGVAVTGYTVVSPTQITFTVPSGATSGAIAVTTPGGTATSTGSFTVTPPSAPDLTVSTTQTIPTGTYGTITVTGTGTGTVGGPISVATALVVQPGGTLDTNCQPLTGAGSFTLSGGATIRICDADGISPTGTSTGAVQVSGSRSYNTDATYVYVGTAAQVTGPGLPAAVRSLGSANANTVTLTAPVSVAQELSLAAGNLALNGQALTLRSDASGTALVINNGAGAVTGGTATVQRYLTTTNPGLGYRHYSSPVSGNTLADLATPSFTPIFNSAYNTSLTPGLVTPFPTVEAYDQSRLAMAITSYGPFDKGWYSPATGPSNTPTAFTAGQGYAANLRGTELVDFTGTLHNGDYALTLARGPQTDAGWALVGNPYPAPLDWSAVAPADRTGLDASMYVFESSAQYAGMYRSYVNGVGGNPLIGSSQGFFVRVSSGQTSGTLTFRNAQRKTSFADQVPVRRGAADARPLVQLTLSGAGRTDALSLYAEAGATAGVDARYDAVKLPNPSGLNLAALASTGEQLAIDGRPTFAAATSIALSVGVPAAGTYTLAVATLANLAGVRGELVDNLTGMRTPLAAGTGYTFTMTGYTAPGRLWLNLTPAGALATAPALTAAQVVLYPNPAGHGQEVTVALPVPTGHGAVAATLLNALGQVVRTTRLPVQASQAAGTLPTAGLAAGVYTLRLQVGSTLLAKRLVID